MATDPLLFMADLLDEKMRNATFRDNNRKFPSVVIQRQISSESFEYPSISIFSHQQTVKPQGFGAHHYLNIRHVRIEIRTDDVEELHLIEEEIQYVVGSNSVAPTTTKYSSPGVGSIKINSTVDVLETIIDTVVYRRSIIIDVDYQYSY